MKLGYPTITWGGVTGTPGGVTSVKDLFYRTNGDTAAAFRDIGAVGYTGTEVFDGNLLDFEGSPEEFQTLLDASGLELVSVYTGANFIFPDILADEFSKIQRSAELAQKFGAKRLVFGGGAQRAGGPHSDDMKRLADGLDRGAQVAHDHGLESSYHPHLGTLVEGPDALAELMDITSIRFCPDTAHLAAGGGDPAAIIDRYADRLAHVHLKDLDYARQRFVPLGQGDLDFTDILRAIRDAGYDSWLMVELDYYDGDPKTAAQISMDYLTKLLS